VDLYQVKAGPTDEVEGGADAGLIAEIGNAREG
jgi:hypothetical protein